MERSLEKLYEELSYESKTCRPQAGGRRRGRQSSRSRTSSWLQRIRCSSKLERSIRSFRKGSFDVPNRKPIRVYPLYAIGAKEIDSICASHPAAPVFRVKWQLQWSY